MGQGLTIERRFTTAGRDVYETVEWSRRDSRITNPDGSVVFEMRAAEIPAQWSQVAADIMVSKYFRKAGVPQFDEDGGPIVDADGKPVTGPEHSAKQVIKRLASTWRWWGEENGYFATADDAEAFEDELAYMLLHQMAAPNSPQWFNTGLAHEYGITGTEQGFWYVDPETEEVVAGRDSYSRPAPHACFINAVDDDLVNPGGIMDLWVREARLFKMGAGSGANFSNIRAEGEQLSGGGKSSGLMSFLKVGDRAAGAIKSGGTTRRAAKMVIVDIDHPDIEKFISWKAEEEKKVRAMVASGYSSDFNGEAYATVSGQNSNNSVRLSNAFLNAVMHDAEWDLLARTDQSVMKTVKARDLWNQIADAAWQSADPGLQFHGTINEWHTSPAEGEIRASNPCSEYLFLDNTACNLASLNLGKFYDDHTGSFDLATYQHAIRLWTIVLEISVTMAQFPSREIAIGSYDYRTLGLGYANLGSLLMRMGIPYDSDHGRAIAGALTAILTGYAYATSAEMAGVLGPFPKYGINRDSMLRVIRNHRRAAYNRDRGDYEGINHLVMGINSGLSPLDMLEAARTAWDTALTWGEQHGFRNAQVSVLAPTGCVVGGSLIPTERGLVRLASLGDPTGDEWQDLGISVATDEGPREASQFYINGVEDVVTVDTKRGYRIQGTPSHRIKVVTASGDWVWKRFGEVEPDDLVPLQLNQLIGEPQTVTLPPLPEAYWTSDYTTTVPRVMNAELGEFLGYFMGDGSVHSKGIRLAVAQDDFDVVERLKLLGKELFGLEAHTTTRTGYTEVAFHSVRLTLWWEACGFAKHSPSEDHSGKGYHPHIPDAVLHSNNREVYAGFARGLFEADGTVNAYPSWSTTSLDFSRDMQSLLLAMGFPTTRKIDRTGWGDSDLAVLRLLNLSYNDRWASEIGFMSARKQNSIAIGDHPQTARRDYVPVSRALIDRLAPGNDHLRKTMLLSLSRIGMVSRRVADELLARTSDAELASLLGYFYDRVATAQLGEEQLTFDLSVPDNVTYIANGFVSHNTIGLLMDCDTTGVEPDFALVKFKKLAGGGYFKIANQSIAPALRRLGYSDNTIQSIIEYVVGTNSLARSPHVNMATLIAKGFTADDLDKIDAVLPGVFEIGFAFNQWTLGQDVMLRLGFTPEQYNDPGFSMLKALGYTDAEIQEANDYICGHQTIEGAPHLRDEHLAVFDTANRNGRIGKRFIHHTGHIKMMAAAQPFISGAISKCVTGETLLATPDGLVRIGGLHRGEAPDTFRDEIVEVASINGTQKTDAFYYGGMRLVRTATLRSGHRVTGTPNHRLLTARDGTLVWRRLDEIGEGEYVATAYGADLWSTMPFRFDDFVPADPHGNQKTVDIPVEMTEELAFLLGAYAAEGHTTRTNWTITITNADEGVLQRVAAAWRSEFHVEPRIKRQRGKCPAVVASSKRIVEFLEYLGSGRVATEKRIPDAVLRSPRHMVLSFLTGMYLDGYTIAKGTNNKMAICVASNGLLDDLQAVLTNLGVVHNRITKHNTEYDRDFDEVIASGREARKLAKLVPFAEVSKRRRAEDLLQQEYAQSTADIVPGLDPKDLYELIPHGLSGRNGWGERSRFSFLLDPRTKNISRRTLERVAMLPMVDLPEWLHTILADGLHFSPVTAVTDAGERDVYDISVPTTHAFVGNGIVNHNTINMPNEVTREDIAESYKMSWELGLKAMAIYRDGSKASQPLSSQSDDGYADDEPEELEEALSDELELVSHGKVPWHDIMRPGISPTEAYADIKRPRFLLPGRRAGYTQEARVGGHKVFVRTGEYEDGTLGELFIDLAKEGATLRGILSCFAIAVSKGLQYGVPLEEYVDTFTFQTFEPRGMVEGHPNIKMANSLIDYVFRALGVEYLKRDELAQVPPDRSRELPEPPKGLAVDAGIQLDLTDAEAEVAVDATVAAARFADGEVVAPVSGGSGKIETSQDAYRNSGAISPGPAAGNGGVVTAAAIQQKAMQVAMADKMGDAPLCDTCGAITVRNGSCYVCLGCGGTTGCS